MKFDATNKELIQDIIEELGRLISIRISRYHSKFNDDDEIKFLNSFIVCPNEDTDGDDLLSYLLARKLHFDEFIDIGLAHFELQHVYLDRDMSSISFSISWLPVGFCTIDNPVFLSLQITKDKIHFPNPSDIIFLESLEESALINLLKVIKKEISFGTLSLD